MTAAHPHTPFLGHCPPGPISSPYFSRADKQKNEPGRLKSRVVTIFLLFLTLQHILTQEQADATLAS